MLMQANHAQITKHVHNTADLQVVTFSVTQKYMKKYNSKSVKDHLLNMY